MRDGPVGPLPLTAETSLRLAEGTASWVSAATTWGPAIRSGLIAGTFTGRLISTYLFGVRPADPTTIVLVAAVGAWIPARQAASAGPAEALHEAHG